MRLRHCLPQFNTISVLHLDSSESLSPKKVICHSSSTACIQPGDIPNEVHLSNVDGENT